MTMVNTNLRMASFRIDSDKWADFIEYARERNTTATSLILTYIDGCLSQSNNGVMTENSRNDKVKNNDNSIDCLKDIQDELIQETEKHSLNIDKLFDLVKSLADENKALKTKLTQLEEKVTDLTSSIDDDKNYISNTLLESSEKISQLNESITATREQLNECRIEAMTRVQLKELLAQNDIKTIKEITKTDLLELVLENDIKVV